MNPWHLRYFIEAARSGSIDAAAKKYRVTSSAVSLAVRSLEQHLDVELLSHKKRRFELTEAGELLAQRAAQVVKDFDGLAGQLQSDLKEWCGPLSFSAPTSLFAGRLWKTVIDIRKECPELKVNVKVGAAAAVRRQVLEGDVDFGLLVDDDQLDQFNSVVLFTGNFHLIGRRPDINPWDHGVVVTEKSKVEVQYLMREAKRSGKDAFRVDMEVQSWTLIKNLCRQVNVAGFVPDYVIEEEIAKKQLYLLDGKIRPYKYEIKMIWKLGRSMPRGLGILRDEYLYRCPIRPGIQKN